MSPSHTQAVVTQYLTAFNNRDEQTIDTLVADDVTIHGTDQSRGSQSVIDHMEEQFQAFPDYTGDRHDLIHNDDLVSVRYTARGTHTGTYKGIEATDLPVSWTGMALYRVADGQIAEIWIEEDRLGLLEQLEVIESTEPAHLRM